MRTFWLFLILVSGVLGHENPLDINKTGKWSVFPYAFGSKTTGAAVGVVAIGKEILQPQATLVTSLFTSQKQDIQTDYTNKEVSFTGGFLSYKELKIPYTNRTYLSILGLDITKPKSQYFLDGSHDSKFEEKIESSGRDSYWRMKLSYVLPLGDGVANPDGIYTLRNGLVVGREKDGGGLPFETGRTTMGMEWYYQKRTIDDYRAYVPWSQFATQPDMEADVIRYFLTHINTDFEYNPSRGYAFKLQYSTDLRSQSEWDFWEFQYSHYLSLPSNAWSSQNIIALNLWSGYSPKWGGDELEISQQIDHRPPYGEGANLGGLYRMRGYESDRFFDRAGLYLGAEYRMTLRYNPLKGLPPKKYLPMIDWFQIVGFVEAGRVHSSYDATLLEDMKVDYGVSLRMMASNLPVRLDIARSDEGTSVWVMIRHPFDF